MGSIRSYSTTNLHSNYLNLIKWLHSQIISGRMKDAAELNAHLGIPKVEDKIKVPYFFHSKSEVGLMVIQNCHRDTYV